jgi:LacI family transcriptional regulator
MTVTIKDIANIVGVSVSTVSLVLNGKASENRISEEMEKNILATAKELDYKPNILARGLRRGKTNSIGFIISDLSNTLFIKLARNVEQKALKYGYKLFFAGTDEKDERCNEVIDTFLNLKVDGLIIAATSGIEDKIRQLSLKRVPFVLIDRYFPDVDTNYVIMNNWQSSYDAVSYLVRKGKKRIATFSYQTSFFHMEERLNGYKAALKDNGIRFDDKIVPEVPFLALDYEIIKKHIEYLVREQKIDSLYFQTTRTALPGIQTLYEMNAEKQILVICFDDNPFYKLLHPPISSLSQPIEELGAESVRILIDEINNKRIDKIKSKTVYSAKFIERKDI